MKLPTLIVAIALFVPSYAWSLDTITDAKQPSQQDIALAEQDAGFGYLCIQSGGSDTFICQQQDNTLEVVINRPSVGCAKQQLAQTHANKANDKMIR